MKNVVEDPKQISHVHGSEALILLNNDTISMMILSKMIYKFNVAGKI